MLNFEKMENAYMKMSLNTSCMSLQTTVKKGTRYKRAPAGGICVLFAKCYFPLYL